MHSPNFSTAAGLTQASRRMIGGMRTTQSVHDSLGERRLMHFWPLASSSRYSPYAAKNP